MDCLICGAPEGTQMLAPKNKGRGRDEKTIKRYIGMADSVSAEQENSHLEDGCNFKNDEIGF